MYHCLQTHFILSTYLTGSQLRISITISKGMDCCVAGMEIFSWLFFFTAISGFALIVSLFAILVRSSFDVSRHRGDKQQVNLKKMFTMMLLRDTPQSAPGAYKTKTWNQFFNVNQKKMT